MSLRLTDEQLELLLRNDPRHPKLQAEAKFRLRQKIITQIPSPEGDCPICGHVRLDNKGAYSSGYWYSVMGYSPCFHHRQVVRRPRPPETARLLSLLESLR